MSTVGIPEDLKAKARRLVETYGVDEGLLTGAICAALLQVRNEAIAQERERAAKIAQDNADEFERLLAAGKGEHCKPGYVTDAVWHAWGGKASASAAIAAAIRARP